MQAYLYILKPHYEKRKDHTTSHSLPDRWLLSPDMNEKENDQLDEWICSNDENMEMFEECLEITCRPKQFNADMGEEEIDLRHITDLFVKDIKQTITRDEN